MLKQRSIDCALIKLKFAADSSYSTSIITRQQVTSPMLLRWHELPLTVCAGCIFGFLEHVLNPCQKLDFLKGNLNPKSGVGSEGANSFFCSSRLSQVKQRKGAKSYYYYSYIHSNPTAALICVLSSFACTNMLLEVKSGTRPRKNMVALREMLWLQGSL